MTIQELETMILECSQACKAANDALDDIYSSLALQKIEVVKHEERLKKLIQAKAALESIEE
jgi:glutaredoxin